MIKNIYSIDIQRTVCTRAYQELTIQQICGIVGTNMEAKKLGILGRR